MEFYLYDQFITEEVLLVYWNDTERAAKEYAERNEIKYDSIKTHFIRKQTGDEI